jgi:threonine dehydratase
MSAVHRPVTYAEARAAARRIAGSALRTPLVRLNVDDAPAEIYLKLENLQPIGSFKMRGAANAMALASREAIGSGVWTASAGNMAQGVAWCARSLGVPCSVVVPDNAPEAKRAAIERLGAKIIAVSYDVWLDTFRTRQHPGLDGFFVHAFSDPDVMAGNATIALEILEDLPDVEAVIVPYGGGGLICGIASILRQHSPRPKVFASEVSTGAPLRASMEAGKPVEVDYVPSFVDGIGAPVVFSEMFDLGTGLIDESIVSTPDELAYALRLILDRNRVVAEGAGAASVAAALSGAAGSGKIACVVSGGNIDAAKVAKILDGQTP